MDPVKSISNNGCPDSEYYILVKDLWSHRQCDMSKLQEANDLDRQEISQIYIPRHPRSVKLIWHYTKDVIYGVKLGYWLASHDREKNIQPHLVTQKSKQRFGLIVWPQNSSYSYGEHYIKLLARLHLFAQEESPSIQYANDAPKSRNSKPHSFYMS